MLCWVHVLRENMTVSAHWNCTIQHTPRRGYSNGGHGIGCEVAEHHNPLRLASDCSACKLKKRKRQPTRVVPHYDCSLETWQHPEMGNGRQRPQGGHRSGCKTLPGHEGAPNWECPECRKRYLRRLRNSHLVLYYGITLDEHERRAEAQGNACAICGRHNGRKRLAVDHDHKTGEVRGLLCEKCNQGLGNFGDDPDRLRKAADYLDGLRP